MTDLTPDHPAAEVPDEMVLAALNAEFREQYRSWGRVDPETGTVLWEDRARLDQFAVGVVNKARSALSAAFPYLTSATEDNLTRLRDTPAGRALMAEAWQEATIWVRYRDGRWPQDMEDDNPYRGEMDQTIEKDLT